MYEDLKLTSKYNYDNFLLHSLWKYFSLCYHSNICYFYSDMSYIFENFKQNKTSMVA